MYFPKRFFVALCLVAPLLAACATGTASVKPPAATATSSIPAGWISFTDPRYLFIISYPPTWRLEQGYDGSHITILNPQTATTISPTVTIATQSPEAVLAAKTTSLHDSSGAPPLVTRLTIDGHPALEIIVPYQQPKQPIPQGAAVPQVATGDILLPLRNTSGTTNVYDFSSYYSTDKAGHMSDAVQGDLATVLAILETLRLPTPVLPAPTS